MIEWNDPSLKVFFENSVCGGMDSVGDVVY